MKHLDITEFLCDECGEAFALQKLLRKHVITIHGSEELRSALFYLVTPVHLHSDHGSSPQKISMWIRIQRELECG
jgi:hypothetical protein